MDNNYTYGRTNPSHQIFFLNPAFSHNVWGGEKLKKDFHYDVEGNDIGECWGISAQPLEDAEVRSGSCKGMHLSQLWKEEPAIFGNIGGDRFPLLVKIIDAKADLSIQVHPDDAYAKAHENGSLGKTECWYILDCEPGSRIVAGHNAKTREELTQMIDAGEWSALIREIPVRKGDFIQIDPGTVHAIKGGIVLLETQQNSDITYRVYDYDRLCNGQKRELHIAKSKDVIAVPAKNAEDQVVHDADDKEPVRKLITCPYYSVYRINVENEVRFLQDKPFLLMTVVEGDGWIDDNEIHKGDHFILPSGYGKTVLKGHMKLIASCV